MSLSQVVIRNKEFVIPGTGVFEEVLLAIRAELGEASRGRGQARLRLGLRPDALFRAVVAALR